MHFNADAFQTNAEPPSITLGGRAYVGRILSFPEWIPYQKMLMELREHSRKTQRSLNPETAAQEAFLAQFRIRQATKILVDAMFPRSRWWRFWETRVSTLVSRLPQDTQLEALNSFMVSQATSLGLELKVMKTPPPATPPMNSSTAPESPGPTS